MLVLKECQPFNTKKEILKGLCNTYDMRIYIIFDDIYYKYKLVEDDYKTVDKGVTLECLKNKEGYGLYTTCKLSKQFKAAFIYNIKKVFDLQTLRVIESIFRDLSKDFIIYKDDKCLRRVTLYPDKLYNLEDFIKWTEKVLGQEVEKIIFLNGDIKVKD